MPVALWLVALACLAAGACTIGQSNDVDLGVPFRMQESAFGCGPATILMWRLYDGLPEVTQTEIANSIGCVSTGVSVHQIAQGLGLWTLTGTDAYPDYEGEFYMDEFFARQITSIDRRVPVIAVLDGGLHAVILNGGKWITLSSGLYEWEIVDVNDPLSSPRSYLTSEWINVNCRPGTPCLQVISSSASAGAPTNLASFGSSVQVRGLDGGPGRDPYDY